MKVACIGTGNIARQHLAAIAALGGDVEIAAVAGRDEARARAAAAPHGAASYGDWRAMLDAVRPDALFVCVTPDAHGAIERAAIERKIPFFVEKPLANEWQLAAELAVEIERAGLVTAVGYHLRYASTVDRAKAALAGRRVGLALGYWLTKTPPPAWWSDARISGGQTVEQLTHTFDLARWLVGEMTTVFGASVRIRSAACDDAATATVTFASGAVGSFSSTHLLGASHRVGLHLYAEGVAVEIAPASVVIDDGKTRTEHRAEWDPTAREDAAFLEAVRTGSPAGIRSTYADALRTHRVTTRVVESASRGVALRVDA